MAGPERVKRLGLIVVVVVVVGAWLCRRRPRIDRPFTFDRGWVPEWPTVRIDPWKPELYERRERGFRAADPVGRFLPRDVRDFLDPADLERLDADLRRMAAQRRRAVDDAREWPLP